ncbi:hypothetical protein ACWEV3_20380 [Saccharopolyspora sp. NPDC003752]
MADERTSGRAMPSGLRSALITGVRRRKPMSSAEAIPRSDVDDLAVVSCGGPLGMAGEL